MVPEFEFLYVVDLDGSGVDQYSFLVSVVELQTHRLFLVARMVHVEVVVVKKSCSKSRDSPVAVSSPCLLETNDKMLLKLLSANEDHETHSDWE